MSRIHSTNTSIENKLGSLLWKRGYRYRKNVRNILGKPDIVFRKRRLLIFCDSSFWHGKDFNKKVKKIKTNYQYWVEKIKTNIKRDKFIVRRLEAEKWKVLRFWDIEIEKKPEKVLLKIEKYLKSRQSLRQLL
jgi:DNA mismatch endonuclease (patch repair protein)